MTDVEKLRERIDHSGYKLSFIADKLNITPQGLYLKLKNTSEFKATEIQILCNLLEINDPEEMKAIFFANAVAE